MHRERMADSRCVCTNVKRCAAFRSKFFVFNEFHHAFTQAYSRDLEFFLERYICRKIGDSALKFVSLICAVVVVSHWFACG